MLDKEEINQKRKNGYYWVFGNKCFPENEKWKIYYWDGHYFWNDGDDFDADTFKEIDERRIVRLA
jgi:hypothetical protein